MDSTHQAEPRPLLVSPPISNKDSLPLSPRVCRCLCHFPPSGDSPERNPPQRSERARRPRPGQALQREI
ncbi:hypothetical protein GW17_00006748 [Ensete ventricosum]|nr:hypothetical protein GW17_00006748 [Ensete ventricosum]